MADDFTSTDFSMEKALTLQTVELSNKSGRKRHKESNGKGIYECSHEVGRNVLIYQIADPGVPMEPERVFEELMKRLKSDNELERLSVACKMKRETYPRFLELLKVSLSDASAAVRVCATKALAVQSQSDFEDWVKLVQDPEPSVREEAIERVRSLGPIFEKFKEDLEIPTPASLQVLRYCMKKDIANHAEFPYGRVAMLLDRMTGKAKENVLRILKAEDTHSDLKEWTQKLEEELLEIQKELHSQQKPDCLGQGEQP
jgi:hypothetical protein